MGLAKGKQEKELSKVSIHGQKRGTFLGAKKCCGNVRKVMQK
jgi:hypothetical protein